VSSAAERREREGSGARLLALGRKLGRGLGGESQALAGRQADREGFPLSLFFSISFMFSFPKPFPNSILKAQTIK
jgi:hypothetical protein